ncbi:MAG: hypothetical protein WCB46_08370 [Methanoregula sp.]
MKKRTAPPDEVLVLLKVTQTDWYGHVRGFPYRVIAIPERASLYDLALAILSSFGFDQDHLFGFYDNLHRYYDAQEGYELSSGAGCGGKFPGVKRAKIVTVFPEPKKKMLFVYDYGDEWRFIVQAKGNALPAGGVKYPVVIESYGEPPDQYPDDDDDPPAPGPVILAGTLARQAAEAWQKKKEQEPALPEKSPEPEDRSQKKTDAWLT